MYISHVIVIGYSFFDNVFLIGLNVLKTCVIVVTLHQGRGLFRTTMTLIAKLIASWQSGNSKHTNTKKGKSFYYQQFVAMNRWNQPFVSGSRVA